MATLDKFTKIYSLSKTLRFELKPIGKTEEWIKKRNIVGVEDNQYIGKDAKKAQHYKYAKRMLDGMHRSFIEDAIGNIDDENRNKLKDKFSALQEQKENELKIDSELKNIFKDIFNSASKVWIEEYQKEMPYFWEEDIKDLEKKIEKENDNKRIKGFNSAIKAIQKKIDAPDKVIKKKNIDVIYSNEDVISLLEWKIRSKVVQLTFKELEQGDSEDFIPVDVLCDYLRQFNKFATYFSGFNENRKNVYDLSEKKEKSTSIIYRIICDNLSFHFTNLKKWEIVKKSLLNFSKTFEENNFNYKKLLSEIENNLQFSTDDFFTIDTFLNSMSQSGIDSYNKIIGGYTKDNENKIQGVNEFINLCCQQAKAKRKDFPFMKELYKQILSKSDKTFIPEFSDDKDLFQTIKTFHSNYFKADSDKQNLFDEFIAKTGTLSDEFKEEYENIFITSKETNYLSHLLTGNWNSINNELLELLGEIKFNKRDSFSFKEIEDALKNGVKSENFIIDEKYADKFLIGVFIDHFKELLEKTNTTWKELSDAGVLESEKLDNKRSEKEDKGFKQVAYIKVFLDSALSLSNFVKGWQADKKILNKNDLYQVWYDHLDSFVGKFQVVTLYNMTRNYISKKPTTTEKLKINFENATLLNGWDKNKESDNYGVLLKKENQFYLAVMNEKSNYIFDYEKSFKDSAKKSEEKEKLRKLLIASPDETFYQKMNYKLLPGANKMLPKVFFGKSNKDLFNPSEHIIKIKEEKLYTKANIEKFGKQNLYDYIDFCIESLCKHSEWSKAFNFSKNSFKKANQYESIDQFYQEVELKGYSVSFDKIKESYISEKIESGEIYLFQIYNKNFSLNKKRKGKDNLHTIYWKALFEDENLKNTVLKLNGEAEMFFRKASIKYSKEIMEKGHHVEKLKGKFEYPIIKDRRFTTNKFFFHCPITLNFGAPTLPKLFNNKICSFLQNNKDINIIGIDRGERHLLYYSVINKDGEILEQKSLNEISHGVLPNNKNIEKFFNYHKKLDSKEKDRDMARKSWGRIENIKELKAGYLSQVVHKLAKLIIKYNAIVVLEDLNQGFKRGRFGIEKQIYQKFEKALIDKLNYLVFKDREKEDKAGHYLNAYQLTNKFESFKKLGRQTGILFYTTASYTSTTDPVSGFLKNVYSNYINVEKTADFWKGFDSIIYNSEKDYFEFTYTLGKVQSKKMYKEKQEDDIEKKTWTVCSCVTRSRYIKAGSKMQKRDDDTQTNENVKKGYYKTFFVTDEIKELLKKNEVDFLKNTNIKTILEEKNSKKDATLQKSMLYYFNSIMNMRVYGDAQNNDFILSPIKPFFDSRKVSSSNLPENGDANGAYNIARKGLCILKNINNADDLTKVSPFVSKQEWQDFVQNPETVKRQSEKYKR